MLKMNKSCFVLPLVFLAAILTSGSAKALVHPSVISTQSQLDTMRTHILTEPNSVAAAGWGALLATPYSSLDYVYLPQAVVEVVAGGVGPSELAWRNDGHAARSHALQWVVTGNTAHRDKALAILNDWADTFIELTPSGVTQLQLESAWALPVWLSAADIMRYYDDGNGGSGWTQAEIDKFDDNYASVLYAEAYKARTRDTNWAVSACLAMMTYGAWTDDVTIFEEGLNQQLDRLDIMSESDGWIEETCRDNSHPQYSIISWSDSAELAYNLGYDDLYNATFDGQTTPRLAIILEYFAGMMLGETSHPCGGTWGYDYVGQYNRFDNYEVSYQHYVVQSGAYLPYFAEMVEDYWRYDTGMDEHFLTFSRMTHGDDVFYDTSPQTAAPTGFSGVLSDLSVTLDWDDNMDVVKGYNLYRSTTSGVYETPIMIRVQEGNYVDSDFMDSDITAGETYYYVVTAIDNAGNESGYSNEISVTISGSTTSGAVIYDAMPGSQDGNGPEKILDGDIADDSRWSYSPLSNQPWVIIDYGEEIPIVGTKMWTYESRAYQFIVEASNSPDSGYVTVVDRSGNTDTTQPISDDFSTINARYLRVTVTGASGYTGSWSSLTEFAAVIDIKPGDLTGDGAVDMADIAELGRGWQTDYDLNTLLTVSENWLVGVI
ncbi:MAG: discoidin domain-containing protein [Planctomycetota bacterium]